MNLTCPFNRTRSRSHFRSLRLGLALLALLVSPLTGGRMTGYSETVRSVRRPHR